MGFGVFGRLGILVGIWAFGRLGWIFGGDWGFFGDMEVLGVVFCREVVVLGVLGFLECCEVGCLLGIGWFGGTFAVIGGLWGLVSGVFGGQ